MIVYRVKHQNIISELFVPQRPNGISVVFFPGLPASLSKNKITESLVKAGCTVFQPFYTGSFDSDGKFSPTSCIKDIGVCIEMTKKKKVVELYYQKEIPIKSKRTVLIGTSFGSSVVLLGDSSSVSKIALLSPVLSYRQKDIEEIEPGFDFYSQMRALQNLLKKGYPHSYRIRSFMPWKYFLSGNRVSVKLIPRLRDLNKATLLVHGKNDASIPWTFSKKVLQKVRNKNIVSIFPECGHSISSYPKKTIKKIVKFIIS